jgi:hypothetical protein
MIRIQAPDANYDYHHKYVSNDTQYICPPGLDSNLEDAIDCCIGSSHIPYVTGNLINTYHNTYTFDGGFSKYPYLKTSPPVLHITPSMWKHMYNNTLVTTQNERINISDYTTLFSRGKYNFKLLYEEGYNDAKLNQWYLDNIFQKIQKK